MNQNFKKWLLSGIVFIIIGIVIIGITLALAFMKSPVYQYIAFPGLCILAGYIVIKVLNKIEAVTTPTLTSTHTLIFAIYSTIITSIALIITQVINKLNSNISVLTDPGAPGLNFTSFFGTVHPIYTVLVTFLGLNLAYWYYYIKHPDKSWKDFVPHLCGIMILVIMYAADISRILL